jgi:hypothetical protein
MKKLDLNRWKTNPSTIENFYESVDENFAELEDINENEEVEECSEEEESDDSDEDSDN